MITITFRNLTSPTLDPYYGQLVTGLGTTSVYTLAGHVNIVHWPPSVHFTFPWWRKLLNLADNASYTNKSGIEKLASWGLLVRCLIKSFARCPNNAGEAGRGGWGNPELSHFDGFCAKNVLDWSYSCIAWEGDVSGVENSQTACCHPTYLASLPFQYPLKRKSFLSGERKLGRIKRYETCCEIFAETVP